MNIQQIADAITEDPDGSGPATFYKGMLLPNFRKFRKHRIPGFLGDLDLAFTYADQVSMGKPEIPRVIISVDIDPSLIEDKRNVVEDMCWGWQNPKYPLYDELRSGVWWSNSSGHGRRGIYYGKPVDDYDILVVTHSPEEFHAYWDIVTEVSPPAWQEINRRIKRNPPKIDQRVKSKIQNILKSYGDLVRGDLGDETGWWELI